jgi:hypothetical protein
MAGTKERYKVQFQDGTIRTVTAQGYQSAKRQFIATYHPPKGTTFCVWPMGSPDKKKRMRV